MDKRLIVLAGILIIAVIVFASQLRKVNLSPGLLPLGDGCSFMTDDNRPAMTPEMITACNEYCDLNFPDEPGCKEAVRNLRGIPAYCHAEPACISAHFPSSDPGNNEIYPPETCEVRKKGGVFTIDMDCEICNSALFFCYCKQVEPV